MIELRNISKTYRTKKGWHTVLDDISITLPTGHSVGILGLNGSGKSTLLRIIGGVEEPDRGEIYKNIRLSWPIGFTGGFQGSLTGRENTRFIGRIYGSKLKELESNVENYAELEEYFEMPVRTYSNGMRARLAFALSMAIHFDCYLVDEITAVGDQRFREKYHQTFVEKQSNSTVIMVSHQANTIKQFCDMSAVLQNGKLILYESVEAGMDAYNRAVK